MNIVRVLMESRLFDGLMPEDLQVLAAGANVTELKPGDVVVQEGAVGDSLFIVAAGEVEVLRRDASGASRPIATMRAGEFFGEMSLLDFQPRSATVRARTDTTLVELTEDQLSLLGKAAHDAYDAVIMNVARALASRLRAANLRLV